MATRALVGITENGETVDYIYNHFDGYPTGLGAVLVEHYTTVEHVRALLDLGDASSIESTLSKSCFYQRDRFEDGDHLAAKTVLFKEWKETIGDHCADYGYIFDVRTGKWTTFES
jgi:arylsulfatase A-like enzyme